MLQKFNITTYAVALCLFAFMLFTAAPVFADPQGDFEDCKAMKWSEGKKDKKNCYKDLAEELIERNANMRTKISQSSNIQDLSDEVCVELLQVSEIIVIILNRHEYNIMIFEALQEHVDEVCG